MSARRGFTMVELMVALTLALALGGVVHWQLLQSRRLGRAQAERIAVQENVRVAALALSGELGALGYDEVSSQASAALGAPVALRSDLLAIAPGAVTYLAGRGTGRVCGVVPGPPAEVRLAASSWTGLRAPRTTDSLLVFVESDTSTGADDAWIHLGITAVAAATCSSGEAAMGIRVIPPVGLGSEALSKLTEGSPARLVEVMQMRYYASGGKSWLGMRSVSTGEVITPVAGPLADSTAGARGLTLRYLDAADGPTADPGAVRSIELALLGVTDQPIHGQDVRRARVDSLALTLRVAPRNALRP